MADVVVVKKIELPSGVTRSTHFLAIKKDLSVVAIEKSKDMMKKAVATRKANAVEKRKRTEGKRKKQLEVLKRKQERILKKERKIAEEQKAIEKAKSKLVM